MKKVYLSILAGVFALASTAQQHDLQADLVTPTSGTNVSPGIVSMEYTLTNNGPATIPAGDTVYFGYSIGLTIYDLNGTMNSASGTILASDLGVGQGLTTGAFSVDASAVADGTDICAAILGVGSVVLSGGDPNDADLANNTDCFTIQGAAGINEMSFENAVSVIATNNFISIATENSENLEYAVYSMTGQVVASGEFNSTIQLETAKMNAGIYIVNVTNGTERKSVKVAIR